MQDAGPIAGSFFFATNRIASTKPRASASVWLLTRRFGDRFGDEFSVETPVLDENLVSVRACYDHAREINAAPLALERDGIGDGLRGPRVEMNAMLGHEFEIGTV